MNVLSTKRGSALLIVLGMLSFMVVSAVGFAIFMRQSRAPSSYLRRASSSRYLLKAALANAVARIDGALDPETGYCEGVYDDPYPGVGPSSSLSDSQNGDLWTKRVFTPFGLVNSDETVSTMALEALAYLPPAIINEVRVYSRQTRTAKWRNLSYDMGRYAFTAVDVSDLFDVNKLEASKRRTSAPGERISLASLLSDASALASVQSSAGDVPFVSLADFNIVAGSSSAYAPFIKYLSTGGADASIYRDDEAVKNALFITDTWFPKTNTTASATTLDLTSKQPFPSYGASNFFDIDNLGNDLYDLLRVNIGGAGLACLYDYLDANRTPISLSLPTVETQPMIASVSVDFGEEVRLSESTSGDDAKETSVDVEEDGTTYKITRKVTPHKLVIPQSSFVVSGTAVFPFKRVDSASGRKGSWKVEALAALFFAEDEINARFKAESVIRPKADYWTNPPTTKDAGGVVWIKGTGQSLSFDDNIDTVEKAVKDYQVEVSLDKQEIPIYYEVTEKKQRYTDSGGITTVDEWTLTTTDQTRKSETGALTVFTKNGETHDLYKNYYESANYKEEVWIKESDLRDASKRGKSSQNFIEMTDETTFRPYIAVWVRVTDSDKTVDLVPASYLDDEEYLQNCSYDSGFVGDIVKFSGSGAPILDFKYKPTFSFKTLTGEEAATFYQSATLEPEGWSALYAADPRYNFAPEDWFGTTDEDGASPEHWKSYIGVGSTSGLLGNDGRDTDIFMFTSDQEYLQSIGELAFLPYIEDLTGNADFIEGDFMNETRYHGKNDFSARAPTSTSGFANGSRFWKTYTAFDRGDGIDPIYALTKDGSTYTVMTGDSDFRINPFSREARIIEAAIKDTPYDWSVASTNETTNKTATKKPSDRAEWAFCAGSSKAKMSDEEIEDLADKMVASFGEKAREGKSWETAFEDFAWTVSGVTDEEKKSLFGVDLEMPLHDVDRKYLYSFWRECFQNRQQLFLVFLRAEPLTVGGSGASALAASQLGARGVALVWRDPAVPSRGGASSRPSRESLTSTEQWANFYETFAPHRTRVLFYHQFD